MEDFYPRSPCGERRSADYSCHSVRPISIHALLAESDNGCGQYCIRARISIHALLAESDKNLLLMRYRLMRFLSTLSLRRATKRLWTILYSCPDFYPRSPCGERPTYRILRAKLSPISIHALLAESDREPTALRTPHQRFLSTLSLRRAT